MTGAAHHRGTSKQDYAAPWEFIRAVEARFGPIMFDLAADRHNTKASLYYTEATDSLAQEWHELPSGLLWLNPPYRCIAPWAEKCALEGGLGASVALLVPASIGANWFAEHVHGEALVLGLHPRIIFVGEKLGYPKDLMLCMYGETPGFEPWRWKA